MAPIAPVFGTNRERNDRSCDKDEIHHNEDRLELAHYLRREGG